MSIILSINSVKGGSLKTTNTINIATCLALRGYKTLIVDLDPQASTTYALGIDETQLELDMTNVLASKLRFANCQKANIVDIIIPVATENLYLAPASLNLIDMPNFLNLKDTKKEEVLKDILSKTEVQDIFDFVLIDNSPSLDVLTINALIAADYIVGSATLEFLSLKGIDILLGKFNEIREGELDRFLGTVAGRETRTKHCAEVKEILESNYKLINVLPTSVEASNATAAGVPLVLYKQKSKITNAYFETTDKLIEILKEKGDL